MQARSAAPQLATVALSPHERRASQRMAKAGLTARTFCETDQLGLRENAHELGWRSSYFNSLPK